MSLNGNNSFLSFPRKRESNLQNILVVGIGNTLRCDDGVGPYVAGCIEAKAIKGVKVLVTQQLHVEDIDQMLAFDRVILIDASTAGPVLEFRRVEGVKGQPLSSSHHLSAETFVNLADSLYHKSLFMQLCSIRGHNFNVGDKITPAVQACANQAVELICSSISHFPPPCGEEL